MGRRTTSGTGKPQGGGRKKAGKEKTKKKKPKPKRSSLAGSTNRARKRAAGLVDPNLHIVVKDELRVQILAVAIQRPYSPSEFAEDMAIPVNVASAHFRILAKYGYLELVREEKVRGAVKHFYRATKSGFISDAVWGTVADALRPGVAGAILQDFIGRTSQSIDTGLMSSRDTACLYWAPRDLDEIAWAEQVKMIAWCIEESKRLEEDTVQRRANGESDGSFHSTFAIAAFPSPTHEEVKKHEAKAMRRKSKAQKRKPKGKKGQSKGRVKKPKGKGKKA
jgi:ribosomal protein S25